MKNILTILIFLLALMVVGFKPEKKIEDLLCNKNWVTNAVNDKNYEISIKFYPDKTYEHAYAFLEDVKNDVKQVGERKILFTGTWSISADKNIHVIYNNPDTKTKSNNSEETYKILSINDNKLKIQTQHSGIKELKARN